MKSIVCYAILIIVACTSCHSVKQAANDPTLQTLNEDNLHLLKGTYHNLPIDDKLNKNYASTYDANALQDVQLLKQFFLLEDGENGIAEQIQIAAISNRELQITALQNGQIVKQFRIKGALSNGYFITEKESKTAFPPLPPFYYFNENVRLYLTLDTANNLVVKRRGKKTGMVFLFASSFKMDNEYRYAPYNNTASQIDSVTKDMNDTTLAVMPEDALFIPLPSGNPTIDQKLKMVLDKVKRIEAFHNYDNVMWIDIETNGEGGKAGLHFTNDDVWFINKVEYGETFRTEMEYYFDEKNGNLIYMTERHYRYNRPMYYDEKVAKENNDTETFDESRSTIITHHNYFENGKLFYRINYNNEPEKKDTLDKIGKEIIQELEKFYQSK